MSKPRAIMQSYNPHDCEAFYQCPSCREVFGSWSVFDQEKNENGTKHYCPFCKVELDGLD